MRKIVLASHSPRRKQLLEWAEIDFDVLVKETDESYPSGMPVGDVAIHIARNKALAVLHSEIFKRYEGDAIILAADTIVVLDNKIIGKPGDRDEAVYILSQLSGKKHEVITGVVILHPHHAIHFFENTQVWFHELT